MAHKLKNKVIHPLSTEKINFRLTDAAFHESTINALKFYSKNGHRHHRVLYDRPKDVEHHKRQDSEDRPEGVDLPQLYMNFVGNSTLKNITDTGGRLLRYYGRLSSPLICCGRHAPSHSYSKLLL